MRYLIGLLLAIFVIIFVIIKLLSGGGSDTPKNAPPQLSSYANTDTTVRYVIDNPVQSNDGHRDVIVSVGRDQATLTITKGYQGKVISSKSYANNENSYRNFLMALDRTAGFSLGEDSDKLKDERGFCATGERYSYDVVDGSGSAIQHFWSTSCKQKTYKGNPGVTAELFELQIPDYDTLTGDVVL
jgi:hypothetical protein